MGIRKRCETQHRLQLGTRAPGMRQPGHSRLDLSLAFSQSFSSAHPVLAQALCCPAACGRLQRHAPLCTFAPTRRWSPPGGRQKGQRQAF